MESPGCGSSIDAVVCPALNADVLPLARIGPSVAHPFHKPPVEQPPAEEGHDEARRKLQDEPAAAVVPVLPEFLALRYDLACQSADLLALPLELLALPLELPNQPAEWSGHALQVWTVDAALGSYASLVNPQKLRPPAPSRRDDGAVARLFDGSTMRGRLNPSG